MQTVSEGSASANITGLLFTLAMCIALVALPRRKALLPVLVLVCYMTMGERIVIAGLNFTMIRVMLLFGWARVVVRGEWTKFRSTPVDTLIIAWTIVRTVNYALVWGSSHALINRAGYAYDIVGAYFLFRVMLRDVDDVYRALRYLAVLIGPLAILIVTEKVTGRNPFAMFGGVPLIPEIRDGALRCQGPFSHSILAGTFGATAVPLFAGVWLYRKSNAALSTAAMLASIVIVTMGASSGPILAFVFGVIALAMWPVHRSMRAVRWAMVACLMVLQVVMNAPLWFVMARLTVVSGSTGWFRGFLIDMTVRHFSEWWLIGSKDARLWHPFLMDVTNQYVAEGLDGGIVALLLFVAILGFSFRGVGGVVGARPSDRRLALLAWSLGATLLTHAVSFISVTYFDQNAIMFYLLLAAIAALSTAPLKAAQQAQPAGAVSSNAGAWAGLRMLNGEWNA
jgi:hypothetical protein